jgi:hypothetical protein
LRNMAGAVHLLKELLLDWLCFLHGNLRCSPGTRLQEIVKGWL